MPSKRNVSDKAYEDPQDFHPLINAPDLDDEEYYERYDKVVAAYERLKEAHIIVSKSQFVAAVAMMQDILVPICEAAAICQTTREYFRTLEKRGKMEIVRPKKCQRKCFIKPSDIIKYLTGKL